MIRTPESRLLSSLAASAFLLLALPTMAQITLNEAPANAGRSENGQPAAGGVTRTYELSVGDQIDFVVYDEPDLSLPQRIDGKGQIRVPLVGTIEVAGMTIRDAEEFVQNLYHQQRILRDPMVTIRILQYAPKQVSIFGAVKREGTFSFPPETNRMDIVDVISAIGGFGRARENDVQVTRVNENNEQVVFEGIAVGDMIRGREPDPKVETFWVYPGDRIYVPETVF